LFSEGVVVGKCNRSEFTNNICCCSVLTLFGSSTMLPNVVITGQVVVFYIKIRQLQLLRLYTNTTIVLSPKGVKDLHHLLHPPLQIPQRLLIMVLLQHGYKYIIDPQAQPSIKQHLFRTS
ncbi:hypothetical protein CR513_30810, partial [Mucuna pruriens]